MPPQIFIGLGKGVDSWKSQVDGERRGGKKKKKKCGGGVTCSGPGARTSAAVLQIG